MVKILEFEFGQNLADKAGFILVDTKYEFGKTLDGKIILIDGEDNTNLDLNKNKKIIFFKRELLKKDGNVFPLNVTIPKKKIINNLNLKPKNLLAPLIPYRYKTYIYKKETDYYDMWQNSLFGVSHAYNNWFESVRYYEMLMNGCIPLILNLKKCPVDTLTQLPKKELFVVCFVFIFSVSR